MVQRGPTYVMSMKGLERIIGGEPSILTLGPLPHD